VTEKKALASKGRKEQGEGREAPGDAGARRMCVATRAERDPEDLIRFAASPEGAIVADLARRLPGRGVWVTSERWAVEKAIKTKAFARALKRPVTIPEDLAGEVERLIERRALAALSLANKAGLAIFGFAQIHAALEGGAVAVLIHGVEAAADGRGKLDRKFEAVCRAGGREPRAADCFSVSQLSLAMGRSNVVHAALIDGGASERFWIETRRLRRYRPSPAPLPRCE